MPEEGPAVTDETAADSPPAFRFYSPEQVTLAGAMGGIIAGGVLMALNYWRLRRPSAVAKTFLVLLAGIACLLAPNLAGVPNAKVANVGIMLASVIALNVLSNRYQGQAFRDHLGRGGQQGTGLAVLGISIVCLCAVLAAAALYVYAIQSTGGIERE